MIEPLSDKPPEKTARQWLADVKVATNLNPQVSEEWIVVDGAQGLKVINRNPDSTESENIYVVHGLKTFAIRTDRNTQSYSIYQRMLSTFRFTASK